MIGWQVIGWLCGSVPMDLHSVGVDSLVGADVVVAGVVTLGGGVLLVAASTGAIQTWTPKSEDKKQQNISNCISLSGN